MDIFGTVARVEAELTRLSKIIERDGINTKVRVWLEDKELNECQNIKECAYVSGEILVLTEGMADDDGLVVVFTVPAKSGTVKDQELESELSGYGDAALQLAEELESAPDPKKYLVDRIEETDKEARELMAKFEEDMKKMRRGGIAFACAIAALALAVIAVSILF